VGGGKRHTSCPDCGVFLLPRFGEKKMGWGEGGEGVAQLNGGGIGYCAADGGNGRKR